MDTSKGEREVKVSIAYGKTCFIKKEVSPKMEYGELIRTAEANLMAKAQTFPIAECGRSVLRGIRRCRADRIEF
jgi:hypothetical protein